ncbi:hypothetical protein ACQEVZ_24645 [Dactylosporangium sp. CA-152071]|uniref:hypothetical protein n=1 Tax=Dactylosporangium sp. CA-152071 TaxID=3239933 RepID=UPI003D8A9945
MSLNTQPLDPDSDAGRAAAHALTVFLADVKTRIRRRERAVAEADALAGRSNDGRV